MGYKKMQSLVEQLIAKYQGSTHIVLDPGFVKKQFSALDKSIEQSVRLGRHDSDVTTSLLKSDFNNTYKAFMDQIAMQSYQSGKVTGNPFQEFAATMDAIYQHVYEDELPENCQSSVHNTAPFHPVNTAANNAEARRALRKISHPVEEAIRDAKTNGTYTNDTTTLMASLQTVKGYTAGIDKESLPNNQRISGDQLAYVGQREAVQQLAINIRVQEQHFKSRNFFSKFLFGGKERDAIKTAKEEMKNYQRNGVSLEETIDEFLPVSKYIPEDLAKCSKQTKQNTYDYEKEVKSYNDLAETMKKAKELTDAFKKSNYDKETEKRAQHNKPFIVNNQINEKFEQYNKEHPENQLNFHGKSLKDKEAMFKNVFNESFEQMQEKEAAKNLQQDTRRVMDLSKDVGEPEIYSKDPQDFVLDDQPTLTKQAEIGENSKK